MTTLPLLFKPSNCNEKNNFIRSFYCLQYDNHYACVWFQTDKIILQLCLANVSFVVRILSQPRTSKMILMLTVYQSVINRMRSHPQQLICWWKSFNAVTWFYYLHFFCTYINVSFDKLFVLIIGLYNLGGINYSKILIKSFWGIWWVHNKLNNPQI